MRNHYLSGFSKDRQTISQEIFYSDFLTKSDGNHRLCHGYSVGLLHIGVPQNDEISEMLRLYFGVGFYLEW
jgi:hypothetical protein